MNESQESWDYTPPPKLPRQLFNLSEPHYLSLDSISFPNYTLQNAFSFPLSSDVGREGIRKRFVIR